MNQQRPPPIEQRNTSQVLKQSTTLFTTHLFTFLFLSFILFTFRSNVENGTHFLTSFIDRDPTLKSLLSRLDISAPHQHLPRRRRPFIQLTRVGTLDDDFFSGDDHQDRPPHSKPQLNTTFITLNPKLGFSNHITDNGITISQIVLPGFSLKSTEPPQNHTLKDQERPTTIDFHFFLKGLELGRRDASSLIFLVGILSASYGYVILGFLVTYAWVLGIVFVAVLNDLLGRYKSFAGTIWDGSNLGLKRLSGFILMRWAVRDALTQLLGIWFFGEIEDQYSFFKIFVRLKLMPFSIISSWVRGYEKESTGFLLSWCLLDSLVGFIFAVDAWVAIVDSTKSGREVVKEGCHLLSTMFHPAINIKCLEGVVCGSFTRWIMSRFCGKLFASAFQSVMEVYFMVAWLVYYLAARSKDATSIGRTFGRRELEGFVDGLR